MHVPLGSLDQYNGMLDQYKQAAAIGEVILKTPPAFTPVPVRTDEGVTWGRRTNRICLVCDSKVDKIC